jgi:hypothetical protein
LLFFAPTPPSPLGSAFFSSFSSTHQPPSSQVEGSKLITSKLDIVTASLAMLRDMLCVKLCYLLRIWKCPPLAAAEGQILGRASAGAAARSKPKTNAPKAD